MARRAGLGKGLSSLIPVSDSTGQVDDELVSALTDIPVGEITPNPNQPRVHFDEEALSELAASIAQLGVLQPVLVRRRGDSYQLIAGERRWRAARRAGLSVVPAIVRTTDEDVRAVEEALVENLHRQDLTALEEAAAYLQLIEDFELTHEQVATRVGKSRSAITNTLRLLSLPPEVQRYLADDQLSAGHAKALLGCPDRSRQEILARQAVAESWSVRTTEEAVRGADADPAVDGDGDASAAGDGAAARGIGAAPTSTSDAADGAGLTGVTRLRPPGLLELEQLLADHLDTRVGVQMGSKRGKVTIDFADLEDLERIYRLICE